MTVSNTKPTISYTYGGAGRYDYLFLNYKESALEVYILDDDLVQTNLVQNSDYAVTLASDYQGGYITTSAPVEAGGTLVINRELPLTQEVDWVNNDPLDAETIERAFDNLVMVAQQINSRITVAFAEAFSYKGEWMPERFYSALNVVFYNNTYWMAVEEFTSGTEFEENNWTEVFNLQTVFDAAETANNAAYEATTSNAEVQASEDVVVAAEAVVVAAEAAVLDAEISAVDAAAVAVASANAAATIVSAAGRVDAMDEEQFVATPGQTNFVLSVAADPGNILVFMNTRKMKEGAAQDYQLEVIAGMATEIVFNSPAVGGEEVEIVIFNTRTAPSVAEAWPQLSTGEVTGGISGMVLSRGGDNTLAVSSGVCRDEENAVWISVNSQNVNIPATPISTTYSVFAMVDGIVRITTDSTGADLPSLRKRWLGVAIVNSSGVLVQFLSSGNECWFLDFDEAECLASLTGTPVTIPISSLLPVSKIESITFGANGPTGQSGIVYISASDSSDVVNTILIESGSTWGSGGKPVPVSLAQNAHVSYGAGSLAIRSVKLKR